MFHVDDRGGISPGDRRGEEGGCVGDVNPDGEVLGISLEREVFEVPGLLGASCLGEGTNDGAGLLAAAHEAPGRVFELLGLELLGSGGTAYTVCLDTCDGGAPVGRADLTADAVDGEVESGPTGLNDFDFWILLTSELSECRFLRNR